MAPPALAVIAGILVDRFVEPIGTATWAAIALTLAGLAAIGRRWPGGSRIALLGAFVALGGGWHHHRWSDLAPDDLARGDWSVARPSWVRGVLMEVPEFRPGTRSGDAGSTRTVLAVSGISDGRRWRVASGWVFLNIKGDRSDLEAGEPVEAAGSLGAIAGP